jgi:site-specific recombinase XerD
VFIKCQLKTFDFSKWKSPTLFLSPATNAHGNGRLSPKVINTVWNEACQHAEVEGHTQHDARHAMGKHLIEKTGNLAAVQPTFHTFFYRF